jgi:hypothetical protein
VIPAQPLAERVAVAQQNLQDGLRRAGLASDPYRELVNAMSDTIGLFPDLVQRIEAIRQPGIADELVERTLRQAVNHQAKALLQAIRWKTWVWLVGGALAAVLIAGLAGLGAGIWIGHNSVTLTAAELKTALSKADADQWISLLNNNPPLTTLNRTCTTEDGQPVCSIVFWMPRNPATAAPAQR